MIAQNNRKQEILEKYANKQDKSKSRKMILKARRVIKEKLRAKNFRKNYKQKQILKDEGEKNDN